MDLDRALAIARSQHASFRPLTELGAPCPITALVTDVLPSSEAVGLLREHVCRGKRLRVIGYEDRAHVVDGNQQRAFPDGLGEVGEQTDCLECVCRWQRKPHRPGAVARPCKRGGAILDDGIPHSLTADFSTSLFAYGR